jgi:ankyrin repeat protein
MPSLLKDLIVGINSPDWIKILKSIKSSNTDQCIKNKIHEDRYLIHYALRENAPTDFIIQLINEYPEADQEKDSFGCYPLQYATLCNESDYVNQKFIERVPKTMQIMDYDENYALHLASEYNKSESIIQLCIQMFQKRYVNRCSTL